MNDINWRLIEDVYKNGQDITPYLEHYFDTDQIEQILYGFRNGLPLKYIKIFADPRYTWKQMQEIRYGLEQGLTVRQINVYAKFELEWYIMNRIRSAYLDGFTEYQVKLVTDPRFDYNQVNQLLKAFEQGLTIKQVQKLANPNIDCRTMEVIVLALKDNLPNEQIGFLMDFTYNWSQILEFYLGFKYGLTVEEVETYENPNLSDVEMAEIREKLLLEKYINTVCECGVPYKVRWDAVQGAWERGVDLEPYLEVEFETYQVWEIIRGFDAKLTINEIKSYADASLPYSVMRDKREMILNKKCEK